MKVISLTEPWAVLVMLGVKTWETRSWQTAYRGPLAIHAAQGFPRWAREECEEYPIADALEQAGYTVKTLPRGVILCTVRLAGIGPTRTVVDQGLVPVGSDEWCYGDYSPGRFAWRLTDLVRLDTPIPAKGALGLWEYPLERAQRSAS